MGIVSTHYIFESLSIFSARDEIQDRQSGLRMNKDHTFASEDLGLAPVSDDIEGGDDFDAFNDDTFGAEEVWHEDAHEEVTPP